MGGGARWLPLSTFPPTPVPLLLPAAVQRVAPEAVQSLRQVVRDIASREGFAGLFKGAMPSILKAAPSAAVTFAAYEFFLTWLVQNQAQQREAAAAAGAGAGAAGSSSSSAPRRPMH